MFTSLSRASFALTTRLFAAAATLAAFCAVAHANSVAINFVGNGTPIGTDTTGVVAQSNWNDETANAASNLTGLTDNTSAVVSGLTLTYTSAYNVGGVTGSSDPLVKLYSGHLESPYAAAPAPASVDSNRVTVYLTNIPYATYDIYVYATNQNRVETVYQNTTNATIGTNSMALTDTTQSTFVANDNYVLFSGLTGSSQYFVASNATNTGGGGFNAGFAGIQIVDDASPVPEPASLSLLTLGAASLLFRRRAH